MMTTKEFGLMMSSYNIRENGRHKDINLFLFLIYFVLFFPWNLKLMFKFDGLDQLKQS